MLNDVRFTIRGESQALIGGTVAGMIVGDSAWSETAYPLMRVINAVQRYKAIKRQLAQPS